MPLARSSFICASFSADRAGVGNGSPFATVWFIMEAWLRSSVQRPPHKAHPVQRRTPMPNQYTFVSALDRFTDCYVPNESGCWIWKGKLDKDGYGVFNLNRSPHGAHRISWTLFRGEIPLRISVLHVCDVRRCCNPDHLFLGTHQDNMTDMVKKGRTNSPRGEKCGGSKLSEMQVREIRKKSSTRSGQSLSIEFSVSQSAISRIINGKRWAHSSESITSVDLQLAQLHTEAM